MNQVHLAGDVRQVQRFFNRRVATTDHADLLVAVKETVAGGATAHTPSHEGLFRREAQILGGGAGGDDQGFGRVSARVSFEREGALGQVHLIDLVKDHVGVEALGVLLKALHQIGALHALHIGGPVVHLRGGHQLATLGDASDQCGIQVGACRVNAGGVAGRAGAQDQDLAVLRCAHDLTFQCVCMLQPGRRLLRTRAISDGLRHAASLKC